MKPGDRPFVVGRRTRKGTTVVVLHPSDKSIQPIPGPWTLRAVVAPAR